MAMTLLKPKKANEALRSQAEKLEDKKQETILAIQKSTMAFQETQEEVKNTEAKMWKDHQAFIDSITTEVKELEATVTALEKRKAEAEAPSMLLIRNAEDMMKKADELMAKVKAWAEGKSAELKEREEALQDKISLLQDRFDDVSEREQQLEIDEKHAGLKTRLANALMEKAEKEYREKTDRLDLRERHLVEREKAVKDKENGLSALSETVKKKQDLVNDDRKRCASERQALLAAKEHFIKMGYVKD